ncbi:polysaccharide biosynthesis protein, partial [Georgenia sp. MJ206]|uniref:nucleoside-diphosphate sugar epimerase/dehydratase n=1 Tax=Georgenia wangjunii TaxID=3117730 RepID=UPI002F277AB3
MVLWDIASWTLAVTLLVATKFGYRGADVPWSAILVYFSVAAGLQVVTGLVLKLYQGRYRVGSFEETIGIVTSTVAAGAVSIALTLLAPPLASFPNALAFLAPAVAMLVMAAGRWGYRVSRVRGRIVAADAERTLVYGAGDAGYQLLRLIHTDSSSPYRVVGLIDDNRSKRNLRMVGIPVLGNRSDLLEVAKRENVTTVILAISNASPELIAEISDLVEEAGMKLLVLPPVSEIFAGRVQLSDVRKVEISDILGRRQIETDISSIAGYLTGRRVLVTG